MNAAKYIIDYSKVLDDDLDSIVFELYGSNFSLLKILGKN